MADDKHWIEDDLHKGGLHKSLGIPSDKLISHRRIVTAEHANNPKVAKQAMAAATLAKLRKRCHGGSV